MKCCQNCRHYDGQYCTLNWNNCEEAYKIPCRDERYPEECCSEYESEEEYE